MADSSWISRLISSTLLSFQKPDEAMEDDMEEDAEDDATAGDEAATGGGPRTTGTAWTGAVSALEDRIQKRLLLHSQKLLHLLEAVAVCTLEVVGVVVVVVGLRSRRACASDGPNACECLPEGRSVVFLEEVSRLGKSSELSSQARTWKVLLGN